MNVMQSLFASLEQAGIDYVHFKSNANLDESFAGKGDFDVLADKNRLGEIEKIILSHNGKRHNPVHYGIYPGVDNWLVFDSETGLIYHLHLHYQLATGKALVKDYVIPWADFMFATRVKDDRYGIFITNPNLELLLLSVRCVLKSRVRDWVTAAVGMYKIYPSLEAERQHLLRKTDKDTVRAYAAGLFPEYGAETERLADIIQKETVTSGEYRWLSGFVRRAMEHNRRMSGLEAQAKAALYRAGDLKNKFLSRKLGLPQITKKASLSGGLIIAFVGVDGSGKSTLTREIAAWISRKIECTRFYMGTGDGHTTLYASLLKRIRKQKMIASRSQKSSVPRKIVFREAPFAYLKKMLMLTLVYDIEKNNYKKIVKMHKYRLNGGISVLDRYPQLESPGQNDGPKVPYYEEVLGDNFLVRHYKDRELDKLSIVKEIKPDLIFRLNVTPEVAMQRKEETEDEETRRRITDKINALNTVSYQGVPIVDINTEQPYEEELLEIKRILWRFI